MYKMESTICKSFDLEVSNDNFKYSMCKLDKTKQMVKLTPCVSLIEPINDKRIYCVRWNLPFVKILI